MKNCRRVLLSVLVGVGLAATLVACGKAEETENKATNETVVNTSTSSQVEEVQSREVYKESLLGVKKNPTIALNKSGLGEEETFDYQVPKFIDDYVGEYVVQKQYMYQSDAITELFFIKIYPNGLVKELGVDPNTYSPFNDGEKNTIDRLYFDSKSKPQFSEEDIKGRFSYTEGLLVERFGEPAYVTPFNLGHGSIMHLNVAWRNFLSGTNSFNSEGKIDFLYPLYAENFELIDSGELLEREEYTLVGDVYPFVTLHMKTDRSSRGQAADEAELLGTELPPEVKAFFELGADTFGDDSAKIGEKLSEAQARFIERASSYQPNLHDIEMFTEYDNLWKQNGERFEIEEDEVIYAIKAKNGNSESAWVYIEIKDGLYTFLEEEGKYLELNFREREQNN